MKWLFTWYDHIELNIPNTTNAIDGHFSDLKYNTNCTSKCAIKNLNYFLLR